LVHPGVLQHHRQCIPVPLAEPPDLGALHRCSSLHFPIFTSSTAFAGTPSRCRFDSERAAPSTQLKRTCKQIKRRKCRSNADERNLSEEGRPVHHAAKTARRHRASKIQGPPNQIVSPYKY
jgi:hypothetical protein